MKRAHVQQWHMCAFQFQTGAIRSSEATLRRLRKNIGFNSKLVRLEDTDIVTVPFIEIFLFQFQTGAIRSLSDYLNEQIGEFQFQTGAIRSSRLQVEGFSNPVFQFQTGSIRRTLLRWKHIAIRLFQFQTGAIRSEVDTHGYHISYVGFNSKLVRLEVYAISSFHEQITFQFQTGAIRRS